MLHNRPSKITKGTVYTAKIKTKLMVFYTINGTEWYQERSPPFIGSVNYRYSIFMVFVFNIKSYSISVMVWVS